jgi:hypothetical protein
MPCQQILWKPTCWAGLGVVVALLMRHRWHHASMPMTCPWHAHDTSKEVESIGSIDGLDIQQLHRWEDRHPMLLVSSRSGATPPFKKFSLRSPAKLWNKKLLKHRRRQIRFIAACQTRWPPFDTILAPSFNTVTSYKLGVVQSFALPKYGWWGWNRRHRLVPSSKNRGGTRSFFCTRATVCLAFCFFGPAVVRFFRAVPKPSRQFRSAPSIAHQRPTCQLRHNADPPPGSTSGKEWNALVRLLKIGPCYCMRAWFARAIALPDFWNRRSRGRSLSDRVARADDGGGVRLSLGNEPLPLTLFAINPH